MTLLLTLGLVLQSLLDSLQRPNMFIRRDI